MFKPRRKFPHLQHSRKEGEELHIKLLTSFFKLFFSLNLPAVHADHIDVSQQKWVQKVLLLAVTGSNLCVISGGSASPCDHEVTTISRRWLRRSDFTSAADAWSLRGWEAGVHVESLEEEVSCHPFSYLPRFHQRSCRRWCLRLLHLSGLWSDLQRCTENKVQGRNGECVCLTHKLATCCQNTLNDWWT